MKFLKRVIGTIKAWLLKVTLFIAKRLLPRNVSYEESYQYGRAVLMYLGLNYASHLMDERVNQLNKVARRSKAKGLAKKRKK